MTTTPQRTIWKFPIEITDKQEIKVPYGGIVRHVGEQDGVLCMWIEVDPEGKMQTHGVYVVGTGHPVSNAEFAGSVIADPFVWHVYTTVGTEF